MPEKTTTLNELIISLIDKNKNDVGKNEALKKIKVNFNNNEELKLYLERVNNWSRSKTRKKNKEYDNIYSFEYREESVLVITEGDDIFKLLGIFVYYFLDNEIDIVVCAAREDFLNDFVEHLLKIGVKKENIDDEIKKEKNKYDDKEIAKGILKKIDNLIQKSGNIKT